MYRDYIGNLKRMESECQMNLVKADEAFEKSGQVHTREECEYLQRAAELRSKLSNLSIGEERAFHQRKLRELNRRILAIKTEIDERERAHRKPPEAGGASEPPEDGSMDAEAAGWFKEQPKHSFEDVVGMEELKGRLRECVQDNRLQALYQYLDIPQLRSFFFFGPPGCGKTFIVEAFAHELMEQAEEGETYSYLSVVGSDILSKYVGEAEKNVARLFEEAAKHAPCILFIDEVDGVCKDRSMPDIPVHAASLTTAFLTAYNQMKSSDKKIIFIGATNYPDQVDHAMLDRVEMLMVPLPDLEAREDAFRRNLGRCLTPEDGAMFRRMAEETDTYNYRDIDRLTGKIKTSVIKEVMREYGDPEKALRAMQNGRYTLTWELFSQAKRSCLPSKKDKSMAAIRDWARDFTEPEEPDESGEPAVPEL